MQIRKYNKLTDESKLMKMIEDEEGWVYANETLAEKYKVALATSITYVCLSGGCFMRIFPFVK